MELQHGDTVETMGADSRFTEGFGLERKRARWDQHLNGSEKWISGGQRGKSRRPHFSILIWPGVAEIDKDLGDHRLKAAGILSITKRLGHRLLRKPQCSIESEWERAHPAKLIGFSHSDMGAPRFSDSCH